MNRNRRAIKLAPPPSFPDGADLHQLYLKLLFDIVRIPEWVWDEEAFLSKWKRETEEVTALRVRLEGHAKYFNVL